MTGAQHETPAAASLVLLKAVHTIIWAFFVMAIGAIWVFSWIANFGAAGWTIAVVMVEVAVLALNHGQCPLGPIVARRTDDRRANFDIYLPEWLAARTKPIFGTLFVAAILFTIIGWLTAPL